MDPRSLCLLFLVLSGLPLAAQEEPTLLSARDVGDLPRTEADHRISFGPHALHFGDLRLPSGEGPFPVAIVIHGGCWMEHFADLDHTAPMASALRDASPAERLPLGVPQWPVEGERDRILPGSHGRSYQERAQGEGVVHVPDHGGSPETRKWASGMTLALARHDGWKSA
jgi:pimeloyl-ACP methyl ester carboxylesterase